MWERNGRRYMRSKTDDTKGRGTTRTEYMRGFTTSDQHAGRWLGRNALQCSLCRLTLLFAHLCLPPSTRTPKFLKGSRDWGRERLCLTGSPSLVTFWGCYFHLPFAGALAPCIHELNRKVLSNLKVSVQHLRTTFHSVWAMHKHKPRLETDYF